MSPQIKKILIANRGEIAVRVIRACRELGIQTVAVYSEIDRDALHVRFADEAYLIGLAPAKESYLVADKIFEIAKKSGADAIHPGYGFLSENADFSDACVQNGIQFIGPRGESMRQLGDKISGRRTAAKVGVPTVPGMQDPLKDPEEAKVIAQKVGYPILLKARAGGGGKGMRKVEKPEDMASAFQMASSEAASSFKDPVLFLEKYIEEPHHVEVQILGDRYGKVIALGERECSAQRRHQKIIEESPSPFITESTRKKLLAAAVKLGEKVGYENAGTLEFLVDKNQDFYFLEMNARLQVEHPVTEEVTRIDLVQAQIHIAAGKKLDEILGDFNPKKNSGHALECRIYAENPDQNFMPSPGQLTYVRNPEGPGVRVDGAVFSGSTISVYYDPMIAKLITWGQNREQAIVRMQRALREYQIVGVKTNLAFLQAILVQPDFRRGQYDTGMIEREKSVLCEKSVEYHPKVRTEMDDLDDLQIKQSLPEPPTFLIPKNPWRLSVGKEGVHGKPHEAKVKDYKPSRISNALRPQSSSKLSTAQPKKVSSGENAILAPMTARVVSLKVKVGDLVEKGAGVVVIEAMKMEHELQAPQAGKVHSILVKPGDSVEVDQDLVIIK